MLLADGARYLTDPGEIQTFDALRHKIEARRRAEQIAQAADLTTAMARKPMKPRGDRMRVRWGD